MICLRCSSLLTLPIAYGLPSLRMLELEQEGRLSLGC